jgi:hypothetical protein
VFKEFEPTRVPEATTLDGEPYNVQSDSNAYLDEKLQSNVYITSFDDENTDKEEKVQFWQGGHIVLPMKHAKRDYVALCEFPEEMKS